MDENHGDTFLPVYPLNPGTCYDNLRVTTLEPDEINLTLSPETVFAGIKAAAAYTALLRVRKNFYYSGDVVFIIVLYDTD